MEHNPLFPAFLDLRALRVVVVGGGKVALRKVRALADCGALVRLVAPCALEPLEAMASEGLIEWLRRPFVEGDVAGAVLVVAATDDPEVNASVARAAQARGVLVNVADAPELCSLHMAASLTRGSLKVAVSTHGHSPAAAAALRDAIAKGLGPGLEELLAFLGEARRWLLIREPHQAQRASRLSAMAREGVALASDPLALDHAIARWRQELAMPTDQAG